MRADYRLADGRTLKVQDQQARLFMTLDGKREELQRVGPNQFVSHDSGTRLTFDQLPFADKVEVARAGE